MCITCMHVFVFTENAWRVRVTIGVSEIYLRAMKLENLLFSLP